MTSASEPTSPTSSRLRVLLVEDEAMVAMLLEDMLRELGHDVIGPIARLEKAVTAAQQAALDVALLDVNLAGREIYPVADALAARGIPFVFVTGYGEGALRPPYGGRPTLPKPFRREQIAKMLAGISGKGSSGR